MRLIQEHQSHELAIEEHYVAENVRSAMAIGEARAAVMVAAATRGVPVFQYSPAEVKEAVTGYGRARRSRCARMVMVHLGLDEEPSPLDVSDALAIALTRLAELRLETVLSRNR